MVVRVGVKNVIIFMLRNNTCIEYDGEHHYKPWRSDLNDEKLKLIKLKDRIKDNFCYKNNIKLRRISYKDNLSDSLDLILKEMG